MNCKTVNLPLLLDLSYVVKHFTAAEFYATSDIRFGPP